MNKLSLVYMGTPEFAVKPLEALLADDRFEVLAVVSQPDKPQGRHNTYFPTPVKAAAQAHGIPVLQPVKIKEASFAAELAALQPDFLVTCAYGRILPPHILKIPKIEALNLHASLLPKYRGAAPIQWALLNGDPETGVSLMRMDEELDHGAVFAQLRYPLDNAINAQELSEKLAELSAEIAVDMIPIIADGALPGIEQEHTLASFTKILTRADGVIDWRTTAEEISNQVRACYPWPGTYTFLNGKRLKIQRAVVFDAGPLSEALEISSKPFPEGKLIKVNHNHLVVVCGHEPKSFLQLLELQAEGGKRMSAIDFMQRLSGSEVLHSDV